MKAILEKLCQQKTITRSEAKEVLIGIAQGEYDPVLVSSFLTVFRMRYVTIEELLGFREAMLELSISPELGTDEVIDLCGTGGDGKDTFNISTLSAFVVAGSGVKVAKHGNVGVSSKCGSSDVLTELGAVFTADVEILREQLQEANICYLHAPLFHPAMKNVAPIRRALGVRTFFNLLGPLVNPASPKYQLIGVFSLEIARLFHYLLAEGKQDYTIVHGLDGYDEISLTSGWRAFGREIDRVFLPEELSLKKIAPQSINGGPTKEAGAQIFTTILAGKGTAEQNDVVTANSAFAIHLVKKLPLKESLELARESLLSGAAKKSFETFRDISKAKQ